MRGCWRAVVLACLLGTGPLAAAVSAQSLGSFSWQLAPYCNVITVNVSQDGSVYTLDGYDNQCGAAERGAVSGTAFINPTGRVGLGLTTVTAPGGVAVHLEAVIDIVSLAGSWHDSHGNSGTLIFAPVNAAGSPRPIGTGDIPNGAVTTPKLADGAVDGSKVADGTIGADDINTAEVQRRIAAACPAGQSMTGVNSDGSVACAAGGGAGGVTAVTAGAGLSGGGSAGSVSLAVSFDGPGSAPSAARSDHTHELSGNDNVAVGADALSRTTGEWNTAVGASALQMNTSGRENVALGRNSLQRNTTGGTNTAIGSGALGYNSVGGGNVAVGTSALDGSHAGASNTAVGAYALTSLDAGRSNIAIGVVAGSLLTSGDDNIYLGSSGGPLVESSTIRIGRANQQTRAFIHGIRGVTTGQGNAVGVVIDSTGQLGTVSSSRRTKFDIADIDPASTALVHRLRPVQFRYRQAFSDGSTPLQYGLIAEEVDEVLPALVADGADGTPETVKYHVLPSLLLADVQRLERERRRLEQALDGQTTRVSVLEQRLEAQGRALDELRRLVAAPPR